MSTKLRNTDILFNDSSTQGTAWIGYRGQVFTSNDTFTIPTGVTALKITVVGGGGGAGGYARGSGAGGGAAIKFLTSLTSGNTLAVTVGAGGTGSTGNGGTGGTSQVASGTQTITTVSATGGVGGNQNTTGTTGGIGSNGDLNIRGQGTTSEVLYIGCAGYLRFPVGGSSILGGGSSQNVAGGAYGGGAGANATGGTGAAGGAGVVIFEW